MCCISPAKVVSHNTALDSLPVVGPTLETNTTDSSHPTKVRLTQTHTDALQRGGRCQQRQQRGKQSHIGPSPHMGAPDAEMWSCSGVFRGGLPGPVSLAVSRTQYLQSCHQFFFFFAAGQVDTEELLTMGCGPLQAHSKSCSTCSGHESNVPSPS